MAIALNLKAVDFVLKCDKDLPPEEQTIFKIKPLTAKQYMEMADTMEYSGETVKHMGLATYNMLKIGLIGWKNFKDAEGNDVSFITNMDDNLNRIPADYRMELSTKITELTTPSIEKVKN